VRRERNKRIREERRVSELVRADGEKRSGKGEREETKIRRVSDGRE
jgi:hypothetical protein